MSRLYDHPQFQEAQAYAWGRQDTGDEERDTERSAQFAQAYAERCIDFDAFRVAGRPNLQAAYEQWRATGRITDGFYAPTRRRMPMPSPDALDEMGAAAWLSWRVDRPCTFVELDDHAQQRWRNIAQAVLQAYASAIDATLVSRSERAS